MSSILKALEKVESDLSHQTQPQNGTKPIHRIITGSALAPQKKHGILTPWGWAIGIVLLVTAGWLLAVNRPPWIKRLPIFGELPATEKEVPEQPGGAAAGKNDPDNAVNTDTTATRAVSQKKSKPVTRPSKARPAPPGTPRASGGDPNIANRPSRQTKSLQEDNPTRSSAVAREDVAADGQPRPLDIKKSLPETVTRLPKRRPATVPPKNPGRSKSDNNTSSIPLLKVSDLKLHAIAWSADPAQRMAVINNNITREGESVSGYTVIRIEQDEIIISEGQEKWRLMLR